MIHQFRWFSVLVLGMIVLGGPVFAQSSAGGQTYIQIHVQHETFGETRTIRRVRSDTTYQSLPLFDVVHDPFSNRGMDPYGQKADRPTSSFSFQLNAYSMKNKPDQRIVDFRIDSQRFQSGAFSYESMGDVIIPLPSFEHMQIHRKKAIGLNSIQTIYHPDVGGDSFTLNYQLRTRQSLMDNQSNGGSDGWW